MYNSDGNRDIVRLTQHRYSLGGSIGKTTLEELESICADCFAVDIMISPMSVLPERGVASHSLV